CTYLVHPPPPDPNTPPPPPPARPAPPPQRCSQCFRTRRTHPFRLSPVGHLIGTAHNGARRRAGEPQNHVREAPRPPSAKALSRAHDPTGAPRHDVSLCGVRTAHTRASRRC